MPIRNTRIDTRTLDRLAREQGEWVKVTPASPCPCALDRARPVATCKICGGFGTFWDDGRAPDGKERARLMRATVADATLSRRLFEVGELEEGDLVLGPSQAVGPQITLYDRIEFTTPRGMAFSGENCLVKGGEITLSYRPVTIESILTGTPQGGAASVVRYSPYRLPAGATLADAPADADCVYWAGTQQMAFRPQRAPKDGTVLAVRYRAHLEWICYKTPRPRFQRATDLSEMVALQLKHRLLAKARDLGAGPEPEKPADTQKANRLAW